MRRPAPERTGRHGTALRTVFTICAALCAGTATAEEPQIAIGVTPEGISCVLGGVIRGRISPAKSLVDAMSHSQEYTMTRIGKTGPTAVAIGSPQEDCEDQFGQELSLGPDDLGKLQVALRGGVDNVKKLVPLTAAELKRQGSAYESDVRVFLNDRGFPGRIAKLSQLIKADLDGDGIDDVLINAADTARDNARKGEYSVVLVKRGKDGAVIPLNVDITEEDSDAPSLLWDNTVVSIADLDGDGTMEIILYGAYYYGDGWQVFRLGDTKAEPVLTCGCGG